MGEDEVLVNGYDDQGAGKATQENCPKTRLGIYEVWKKDIF